MPFIYSIGCTSLAAADLIESLLNANPEAPFAHIGETQLELLIKIETLFQSRLNKSGAPPRGVQISPLQSVGDPAPPRVSRRITAPYPRVVTLKTLVSTITYYRNT